MAGGLLSIFDPAFYNGPMAGLLGNLPAYQTQMGQGGFDGAPTDLSGQSRAPLQVAPQMPAQAAPAAHAAPQMGLLDRIGAGLGANSNTMLAMGASLLGGQGFGGAANAAMTGRQLDQKQATVTQTEQALLARGLSPDVAKVAARNPSLLAAVLSKQLGIGKQPGAVEEYEYAKKQGFGGSFQDWIANKRAGAGELGLNIVYGQNDKGEIVAFQPKKSGGLAEAQLPPGVKLLPSNTQFKDLGTEIGIFEGRTGQRIGTAPKNIAGKEREEERGRAEGKAEFDLPRIEDNATFMLKAIDDVEKDPYRALGTGKSAVGNIIPGTPMYDFGQKVEQLRGKTFLEAFNSLRGGGQITEAEGRKATDAIARLSTFQTEEGFAQALKDLREVVVAGAARARKQARQPAAPAAQAAPTVRRYNPATGKIE